MGIGKYITIFRVAAKFLRAYSKAIKLEEAKDGNVSWLDRLTCVFDALTSMDEGDIDSIIKAAKKV